MGNPLREWHTPAELAAGQQVIEISDKVSDFERLAASIEADLGALDPDTMPTDWRESSVSGELRFGFAGARDGLPALDGKAEIEIYAVCQRCLKPMKVSLEAELRLLFEEGDYDDYEVWELEEEALRPIDIVDEALVMAIPMTVLHEDSQGCRKMMADAGPAEDKTRPFAALRAQMDKENSAG